MVVTYSWQILLPKINIWVAVFSTRASLRMLSPFLPFGKWMHLWQIIRPKKNGTIWLLLAGADYLDIAAILSSFLCSAFFHYLYKLWVKSFKCNDFSFGKVKSSFQSKDMNEKDNLILDSYQTYWFTVVQIFHTTPKHLYLRKIFHCEDQGLE